MAKIFWKKSLAQVAMNSLSLISPGNLLLDWWWWCKLCTQMFNVFIFCCIFTTSIFIIFLFLKFTFIFFLHVFIVNLWFFFFIFQTTIVSGRRGSTSSDKKRSKSRARSKSPFRSFRWPKSKSAARQEPQPGSYSDDEDNVSGSARSTLRKFFRENIIW